MAKVRWYRTPLGVTAGVAIVVTCLATAVVAFAASLGGLPSTKIGQSSASVTGCSTTGLVVRYTNVVISNATYNLTQVNLSAIPAGCVGTGKVVSAAVSNGTTSATGTATITSGTTANIVLSPTNYDSSAVKQVSIVFTG